jgi:periplasmic divalent cation tolerance protein
MEVQGGVSFPTAARCAIGSRMDDTAKDGFIVVLCTVPSVEVGAQLGRILVEQQLAACVNILPGLRSIYRWQGAVHDDAEAQLVIKTRAAHWQELLTTLRAHHPYDEPEVIALPVVQGSPTYLQWLEAQTQRS